MSEIQKGSNVEDVEITELARLRPVSCNALMSFSVSPNGAPATNDVTDRRMYSSTDTEIVVVDARDFRDLAARFWGGEAFDPQPPILPPPMRGGRGRIPRGPAARVVTGRGIGGARDSDSVRLRSGGS